MSAAEENETVEEAPKEGPAKMPWQTPDYERLDISQAENTHPTTGSDGSNYAS
jgi:hypothetical protein